MGEGAGPVRIREGGIRCNDLTVDLVCCLSNIDSIGSVELKKFFQQANHKDYASKHRQILQVNDPVIMLHLPVLV